MDIAQCHCIIVQMLYFSFYTSIHHWLLTLNEYSRKL